MKQFTQNRFLVMLVAILLLANLALLLFFVVLKKEPRKDEPRRPVSDFVQKELGFNTEQAAKFQQLRDQHKEAVRPLIDEMQKLKDSLYTFLRKPETPDSTITSLANKIGEKQKEFELMIFHHFQQVRLICDSSQLPRFDTLVHRMINKGPWKRKNGPGEDNRSPKKNS